MRNIKVTYRAVFAQPTGPLNPMGMKLHGMFPVEIFGNGEKWQAREIASTRRVVYTKLSTFASAEHGKQVVAAAFEKQLEPWQIWGQPYSAKEVVDSMAHGHLTLSKDERLLFPDEIQILPTGVVCWKELDDYTHIMHGTLIPAGARIPPAACGFQVHVKSFINTRANVEPTCKACAEVWKKEYQNR